MEQKPNESAQQSSSREESPSEFLQSVRGQTSYRTLRSVLMVILVLCILGTLGGAFGFINTATRGGRDSDTATVTLIALSVAALLIVIEVVLKQWFTMFVDMVDTLIMQNRRKEK